MNNRKNCTVTVTVDSVTYAVKAQRALASAAIYAQVIKLDATTSVSGCTYGLEIPCSQCENARAVLRKAGIRPRRIIKDGTAAGGADVK